MLLTFLGPLVISFMLQKGSFDIIHCWLLSLLSFQTCSLLCSLPWLGNPCGLQSLDFPSSGFWLGLANRKYQQDVGRKKIWGISPPVPPCFISVPLLVLNPMVVLQSSGHLLQFQILLGSRNTTSFPLPLSSSGDYKVNFCGRGS